MRRNHTRNRLLKKLFSGAILFYFVFLTTGKLNTGARSLDALMKKWIYRGLVFSAFTVLLAVGKVAAQDAGMSDTEVARGTENVDPDKMVFSPGESDVRFIPKASGVATVKDSVAVLNPVVPKAGPPKAPTQKEEKPKDDSVLTFNFLYYIIQKYKLQDIID